jgi:hypothetical protein
LYAGILGVVFGMFYVYVSNVIRQHK